MADEQLTGELPAVEDAADEAIAVRVNSKREAEPVTLAKRYSDGALAILTAISLAGMAYPMVVTSGFIVASVADAIVAGDSRRFSPVDVVEGVGFGCLFCGVIGFFWAMIFGAIVFPFLYFFVRSLQLDVSIVRLAAFNGGLVGFVAVLPLFLVLFVESRADWWQMSIAVLVGPALTTVLGQIGGAWGGRRVRRYELMVASAAVGKDGQPLTSALDGSEGSDSARKVRFQFGIWHLLVISIWVSLLLTAIRLSGLDFGFAFGLLFGWVVFQTVTLWLGGVLTGWIGGWHQRRKSCST